MSVPGVGSTLASGTTNGADEPDNGLFSTPQDMFGESFNTVNFTQDQFTGFGSEWPYPGLHRRSFARASAAPRVTPSHPTSVSGQSQPFYARQAPMLQPLGSPQYQLLMQSPVNAPAQGGSQHVPAPPGYPPSFRPSSYVQSRQAGVSPTVSQRRRHNRNQGFTGFSPAGINTPRASNQSNRLRSRPAGERGSQTTARLSSPRHQRPQGVPPALPNGTSPTSSTAYPMLTAQQRVQVARSLQLSTLQLGELLRTMDADDVRELQMYDELLRRRYRQELDTYESSPPPKGLDNQNDGRPEPKEAEELMVNLECRICMSQPVDTVMLPCGHAVLCRWCANQHLSPSRPDRIRPKGHGQCPMCRAPVKQKVCMTPGCVCSANHWQFRIYFS